jgi:hypothetical protein
MRPGLTWINVTFPGSGSHELWLAVPYAKHATERTMTFAMAAGCGIAVCVATVVLMQLSSVARPLVVACSSARRMPGAEPPCPS